MAESRLRRFVGGLGLGYVHTVLTVVVGLWLTPYLLNHLESHDYGLWLLGAQVLVYLALLDLGIVHLIPRDVAVAAGRANGDYSELHTIISQTARIVLWQMPLVAVVGALVVWLLPIEWAPLRGPLAVVVIAFIITFPLRVFIAVLQGLQDLACVGVIQLIAWGAGAAATVAGIVAGLGLYSLSLGWSTTQLVSAIAGWRRLLTRHRHVLPPNITRLAVVSVRNQIRSAGWISVNQVAQVLLAGTDLLVIGKLLGPEAVVPYACTGKLLTLLANQPQMFLQMALPALSELRTSAAREHLFNVARTMAQVMLLLSGAIAGVVLAVNQPFVVWWVGDAAFAGVGLTAILLVTMLVRHFNLTLVYTLFCFGHERRLALTAVCDGLVGLGAMIALVPLMGVHGAALGTLVALCAVSLPANLLALARVDGGSPATFIRSLGPWTIRCVAVLGGVVALMSLWTVHSVWMLVPLAAVVGLAYLVVMVPVIQRPPLGPMLAARLQPWLSRLPGLAKHLIKPASALAR